MEFYILVQLATFSLGAETTFSFKQRGFNSNIQLFESCFYKNRGTTGTIVSRSNSSEAYQNLNYQWQVSLPTIYPLAYVVVNNEEDVKAAVRCGQEHKVRIVPKGGGHSLWKFSFGDSNTVIVDVRNLTSLTYNKERMRITAGAGWLAGPLVHKIWTLDNLFTPLGICPTIGISGISTGGGFNFMARKFGLTLDNIVEMNVVTADGKLRTVNLQQESDLFWALRGGVGSSFGIVTKLVYKVYKAPPQVLFGTLHYDSSAFPSVFDAWQHEAPFAPNDLTGELYLFPHYVEVYFVDWTGGEENFQVIAKKFPPNATITTTLYTFENFLLHNSRVLSHETLVPQDTLKSPTDLAKLSRRSTAQIWQKRKSYYVEKQIGADGIRKFYKQLKKMPEDAFMFMECYGGSINDVAKNETAFVHRGDTLFTAGANYADQDGKVDREKRAKNFVEEFYEVGKSVFDHKATYQNYVDEEMPDYLERYYGSNLPRLIQIKNMYDPGNFFFNQQSVPTRIQNMS